MHSFPISCVRTLHIPSLACFAGHTLTTNKEILLTSTCNHGQGYIVRPTVGTPPPNGFRSSWEFLLRRSPDMLAGPTLSTFLVLEGGPYYKLCSHILFLIFSYLSWILVDSSLHDVSLMLNFSTSRGSFLISCQNSCMVVKEKFFDLCTYKTSMHLLMMNMTSLMKRPTFSFHAQFTNPHNDGEVTFHPTTFTHLSSSAISLNLLSIILIQDPLTKNYKTMEYFARIAYGFLAALPCIAV